MADVEADGDFDTHDDQAELGGLLADVSECLAAFQADLEARGVVAPRADVRLVGVRPPPGGERLAAPTTARAGSPGCQGDRARRRRAQRLPRPQPPRRHDNLQVTIDFRRVYSSLLEQWLGTDAGAVIPRAGAFGRVALVQ